jgi:glycosyl transferase family 87
MREGWLTARRLHLHALALLVALWGVTAANLATRGAVAVNGHLKGEDYAHFYALGRVALAHDAAGLYDSAAQTAIIAAAIPDARPPTFVPVYGPQVALVFAPFALLPYLVSLALWWTVSIALYLACCWQFWRRCPELAGPTPRFLLFALAYPGFWELIVHGQTSVLVLGCFTMLWTALRNPGAPRHVLGGIAMGLLFYKPQLGIAAAVVLLASGRWRMLAVAALTVCVQFALVWAWFGGGAIVEYTRMLRLLPGVSALLEPNLSQMCSLRGFFQLLGVPEAWGLVPYAASSAVVLAVLVRAWRSRPPAIGFALLLLATILVAPHATVYDLVILAPALILLANEAAGPSPACLPWLYVAYLAPLSGVLAAVTRVQLVAPVLCVLLWTVARAPRTRLAQAGQLPAASPAGR